MGHFQASGGDPEPEMGPREYARRDGGSALGGERGAGGAALVPVAADAVGMPICKPPRPVRSKDARTKRKHEKLQLARKALEVAASTRMRCDRVVKQCIDNGDSLAPKQPMREAGEGAAHAAAVDEDDVTYDDSLAPESRDARRVYTCFDSLLDLATAARRRIGSSAQAAAAPHTCVVASPCCC